MKIQNIITQNQDNVAKHQANRTFKKLMIIVGIIGIIVAVITGIP